MVCQNQSIDDSDAPLAADLRVLLRERIAAGDSDAAVVDFLVARYGEFILLKPRFNWGTALLWDRPAGPRWSLAGWSPSRLFGDGAAGGPLPLDAREGRSACAACFPTAPEARNITES